VLFITIVINIMIKVTVICCAGIYFLFVIVLSAVSLTASVVVMYVHGRSAGIERSLAMPNWVSLLLLFKVQLSV